MRFEDQVAIVTGGAQGLGAAVTRRLVKEGCRVCVFDRDEGLLENAAASLSDEGVAIDVAAVDVAREASVSRGVSNVVEKWERLDIMVNCAGIVGPNGVRLAEVPTNGFDEVIEINLRGSFLMTKYAVKVMESHGYGRILLVASIAGKEGNAGMCAYSASKAGVIGLVKSAGKEYAESGVTVNGLAPAVIRTAMVEEMETEQVKYMTDRIPMQRCGTLEEVASMATWIVSPEASFNTGFTFDLSGGRAVY